MDVLQNIIKSLEKEEIKSYKLYTRRTHDFSYRKDIELFGLIKKNPDTKDHEHCKAVYSQDKPDGKYYRLKNKIVDDLGVVLTNLNRNRLETETLHLTSLAKIFLRKQAYPLTQHYLLLAEKKAHAGEDYATLEIIYEQLIQLSVQYPEAFSEAIIDKRIENSKRLALLQELENNFALLSHKLNTTQNLAVSDAFKKWIRETLHKTQKLSYVKNSATLRIKIFQNLCRLLLLLKDYASLEKYLIQSFREFEEDKLFNRHNHEVKMQLIIYLCNASYVLGKYGQALDYAARLEKALYEYDKLLYDKYVFYYYNILVNNYSKTNAQKALETLEHAMKQPVVKNNPSHLGFILLNLAITHFDLEKYRQANKYLVQLYVSDAFRNYDEAFKLKVSVFELVNKTESGELEQALKLAQQVQKNYAEVKDKKSLRPEKAIIDLVDQYMQEQSWRKIKPDILKFIQKYPAGSDEATIIDYAKWLSHKVAR